MGAPKRVVRALVRTSFSKEFLGLQVACLDYSLNWAHNICGNVCLWNSIGQKQILSPRTSIQVSQVKFDKCFESTCVLASSISNRRMRFEPQTRDAKRSTVSKQLAASEWNIFHPLSAYTWPISILLALLPSRVCYGQATRLACRMAWTQTWCECKHSTAQVDSRSTWDITSLKHHITSHHLNIMASNEQMVWSSIIYVANKQAKSYVMLPLWVRVLCFTIQCSNSTLDRMRMESISWQVCEHCLICLEMHVGSLQ